MHAKLVILQFYITMNEKIESIIHLDLFILEFKSSQPSKMYNKCVPLRLQNLLLYFLRSLPGCIGEIQCVTGCSYEVY